MQEIVYARMVLYADRRPDMFVQSRVRGPYIFIADLIREHMRLVQFIPSGSWDQTEETIGNTVIIRELYGYAIIESIR